MKAGQRVMICQHCKEPFNTWAYHAYCPKCSGEMAKRAAETRRAAIKHASGTLEARTSDKHT